VGRIARRRDIPAQPLHNGACERIPLRALRADEFQPPRRTTASPRTEDPQIAALIGSSRSLRQPVSLALVHPGQDLAGQQIHSEYTQRGDSFEDRFSQMRDCEDGSEGRRDLDGLVLKRAGQPDHQVHEKQRWSVDDHQHHQPGVDDGLTASPERGLVGVASRVLPKGLAHGLAEMGLQDGYADRSFLSPCLSTNSHGQFEVLAE
jgi:hypothetical protein